MILPRHLLRTATAMLVALLVLTALPAVARPAAAARGFGSTPLQDVLHWANQEKRCGLSRDELAALMLAPTFPETGAPGYSAPSPMTMSRWDNQSGLHSFDNSSAYRSAFWHPGIGPWQFDSAGLGTYQGAHGRIDTFVAAAHAADTMAARWCASSGSDHRRRTYVWAPWYGCGSTTCHTIFAQIFNGSSLVGVNGLAGVTRSGGMEQRTCTGPGQNGSFPCWRVDPAEAEGHNAFAAPGYGPAPITAAFYVYTAGGKEYRHWLRSDTGYDIGIWGSRPLGANARSAIAWNTGEPLTDVGSNPPPPPDPGPDGFFDVESDAWFVDGLAWAVDNEVMTGYPDQTFRPDQTLTRAQALMATWRSQGRPEATSDHGFVDVAGSAWFDAALDWADEQGVVVGFPDGTFRPNDPLTRAQYVMMIWRIARQPHVAVPAEFADTTADQWFAPGMSWAVERGYMLGYPDDTFRPLDPMTRAQAVMTFYRGRQFDDIAVTDSLASSVDWARFRGVIKGYEDHTYRPANDVSRGEIVNMIYAVMDRPVGSPANTFVDLAPDAWNVDAVDWAAANGIVSGYPDGTFRNGADVSRAQVVRMLWRVAGSPDVTEPHGFVDVAPGAWFEPALRWAAANGILDGVVSTTFGGGAASDRGEVAEVLAHLATTSEAWSPMVTPPSTVVF